MKWLRYHWTDHPFYDDVWYKDKTRAMKPEDIAEELEINYTAALKGRVYPEFTQDGIDLPYDYNKQLII